jgi:hypothetical protein
MEYIKKKNHLMQKCSGFLFFIIIWAVYPLVNAAELASSSPSDSNTSDGNTNGLFVPDIKTKPENQNFPPPVNLISMPAVLPDDENNIRLLELSVGSYKFDELIMVYQHEDILFVPFGAISELIDLAIKADPSTGTAKGFIFNEKKTFFLDINRSEVTMSGVMKQFDNKRTAARVLDDIYVDSDLLSEWLPLKINIDLYASRLRIKPDRPLPFQLKKERESRMKRTQGRLTLKDRGYPKFSSPYQQWGYPHINLNARAGVYKNNTGESGSVFSHATYATADLFNMESAWYVAGNQDKFFDDSRVTFGKKNVNAELLGPVKAREYAVGHVVEPRIDLINRPGSIQPGLFVSSYPLTRQLQYDSHSFSGDLPPGWEVELYRNNSLLNYQSVSVEGRYQFDDVPLLFGHNYFRLVFYGPQGQTREETKTFELGQSLTLPGEQYYRVLVTKDEESSNSKRTVMQYDIGVNKQLSATAGFASLPIDDSLFINEPENDHHYITAGLRGFQKALFYKINHTSDSKSGSALDWGVQSRLGPVILNASEIYFNDNFISEIFGKTLAPITRRTAFKMDTAIPVSFISRIPISFEYQQDRFEDGSWNRRVVNRISAQKHGYAVTNSLSLNSSMMNEDTGTGVLQVSRRAAKYNLRTNLGYRFKPTNKLDSVSVSADGFKLWGFNANAGVTKVISAETEQFTFGLNRAMNDYTLGVDTRLSTDGTFSLNLTFTMGLAREPRTGNWVKEARPIASQGAVSTQVFLDENGNGKKDVDEDVLSGVKVKINGGKIPNKTDENGIAFITGLQPYREMDFDIALDTLEDPFWLSAKKGVRVNLRPGHVTKLDFPIIQTGEIDGTTFVSFGDIEREANGVIVELVDGDGTLIQSVKSAYDGFFLLQKLPMGNYQLRISEKQIEELDLQPIKPINITISNKKQMINGQDFILFKKI